MKRKGNRKRLGSAKARVPPLWGEGYIGVSKQMVPGYNSPRTPRDPSPPRDRGDRGVSRGMANPPGQPACL